MSDNRGPGIDTAAGSVSPVAQVFRQSGHLCILRISVADQRQRGLIVGEAGVDIGAMEEAPEEEALIDGGVEVGNASEETVSNDAMAKDAPLDIESKKETLADAKS